MQMGNSLRELANLATTFSEVAHPCIDRNKDRANSLVVAGIKLRLAAKIFMVNVSPSTGLSPDIYKKDIEFAELFAKWADATRSNDDILSSFPTEKIKENTVEDLRRLKAYKLANFVDYALKNA